VSDHHSNFATIKIVQPNAGHVLIGEPGRADIAAVVVRYWNFSDMAALADDVRLSGYSGKSSLDSLPSSRVVDSLGRKSENTSSAMMLVNEGPLLAQSGRQRKARRPKMCQTPRDPRRLSAPSACP